MSEHRTTLSTARLAGGWDASLQHHISELNMRFLELFAGAASGSASAMRTPIVLELRAEWRQLPRAGLQRLATCPYLLVDAAFAAPAHWRELLTGAVQDAARAPVSVDAVGTDLVRRTLVLAWHLSRANPLAACIRLGMSQECIELIAARSLHQLEAVADTRPTWVRPRWENRVEVWRQLLYAACDDQSTRLRQLQLRGLQLLAGSMVNRPLERAARQ
jgi:hypothetical protein